MRRRHILAVLTSLTLVAAACGEEPGAIGDGGVGDDDAGLEEPDLGMPAPGDDGAPTWTRIEPRFDLVGGHIGYVEEVVVDPGDDRMLLVRFYGGVTECYGANVTVVSHTPDEVTVALEVGSVPAEEGEERICIEIAMAQEIAVELVRPASDAALSAVDPDAAPPDAAESFIGLARADAIARAEAEGRAWRIAVEDGEHFALTMDHVPTRVNFEIEAGVVTGAWMG